MHLLERVAILMNNYLGASQKASKLEYTFQQIPI